MDTPNNEQQQFQCTGDCLKCSPVQRQYCAAQHAYHAMRMLQALTASLQSMTGTIEELAEKVAAIQGSEALLFNPNASTVLGDSVTEPSPTPADDGSPVINPAAPSE